MEFKLSKRTPCEECGGAQSQHWITYIDVAIDNILKSFFAEGIIPNAIYFKMQSIEQALSPKIFDFFLKVGLAKKQTEIDDDVQLLAQMLWREANKRGIIIWEFRLFGLPRNMFMAEFTDGSRMTYEGIPILATADSQMPWTDDKALLKKNFLRLGFPVAKGGAVFTKRGALELFGTLDAPVIVKPRRGSGSRHTTLHITDEDELIRAFNVATQVSPAAIIEEELVGPVYRATVVDGKLVATLRRDQPYVVGDGIRTIYELVNDANKHPARSGPYFSKIKIDDSGMNELKWHGHTPKDILPKEKRVTFHQKVNWSVGGTTADVTDEVHSDNIELFERVAEVLKAPVVGIDFIISDISRSWKEAERCGILECNSMPFFDNHHLPFEGKPRNVAGSIWDMIEKHQ